MKRIFFKTFLVLFILISQFIVIVNAHPGRTDSNGGHYDRSTGEYHYHDGESAGKKQSNNNEPYTYEDFVGPTQDYSDNSSNTTSRKRSFDFIDFYITAKISFPIALAITCVVYLAFLTNREHQIGIAIGLFLVSFAVSFYLILWEI